MYPKYIWRLPSPAEMLLTVLKGEICISLHQLIAGLTLPLARCQVRFLHFFNMVPSMITPNRVAILMGLTGFFEKMKMDGSIENVMSLVTFVSKVSEVYYYQAHHSGSFGLTGYTNVYHDWRERIIFAASPPGVWDFKTVVGLPDSSDFKDWAISKRIQELYREIGSPYFQLHVRILEYDVIKTSKRKAQREDEASEEEIVEVRKKMKNEWIATSTAVAPDCDEEASTSTGNSDSGDDTAWSTGDEEESEEEREEEEASSEEGTYGGGSESAAFTKGPVDAGQLASPRAMRVSP